MPMRRVEGLVPPEHVGTISELVDIAPACELVH